MTKEEISKRFDTPSQLECNSLRLQNDIMRRHIHANERRMAQLIPQIEREGDKAADKLDKDFADWRKVLSSAYLEISKKVNIQ